MANANLSGAYETEQREIDPRVKEVLSHYAVSSMVSYTNSVETGLINTTSFAVVPKRLFTQKINERVFPNAEGLMDNIFRLTGHMRSRAEQYGDPDRQVMRFLPNSGGGNYVKIQNGDDTESWRVSVGIDGTKTINKIQTVEEAEQVGRGFGQFAGLAEGFPADSLFPVIPGFHDTDKRFYKLRETCEREQILEFHKEAIDELAGRALFQERYKKIQDVYEEMQEHEDFTHIIVDMLESGEIPTCVIHADTKCNNVLVDEKTGEAVAAIDLDTVMKGARLYDIGDGLRTGCSTGDEEDVDLRTSVSTDLFKGWVRGYLLGLKERGGRLTETEAKNIVNGYKMMTLEVGMRFATDYLDGDNYFGGDYKTHPDLNLIRARAQFTYFKNIIAIQDELNEIAMEVWRGIEAAE